MEVAGGDDEILLREDCRIVGDAVDFGFNDTAHVLYRVLCRSVNLRYASEGVRVLDVRLLSSNQFAAFQQFPEACGCALLPFMRPDPVGLGQERLDSSVECLQRHCPDSVSPVGKPLRLNQGPDCVSRHELGAVEQGKSFFRLECQWLPAQLWPKFRNIAAFAPVNDFAHSDQRKTEVCQRCEVSRGSERALLINDREYIAVEHVRETLHCLELRSGMPVG